MGIPTAVLGKSKTKYAFLVEADESTRIRLEGALERYHEDHNAAKGINSLSHNIQFGTQIYSDASSIEKKPYAKAAVEK